MKMVTTHQVTYDQLLSALCSLSRGAAANLVMHGSRKPCVSICKFMILLIVEYAK